MESPDTHPSTLGFLQQSTPSVEAKEEKESGRNEEPTLHSSKARFWVDLIIISAYIASLVLAGVHHAFLAAFHRREFKHYSPDERAWVGRASNLLSRVVATSLGVVVATALIQGVCLRCIARSYF
jgi:hypothetical protein